MLQTCDQGDERKRLEEGGQTAVRVECGEPRKLCSHNKLLSARKKVHFSHGQSFFRLTCLFRRDTRERGNEKAKERYDCMQEITAIPEI